jgi:hypothetical protein
MSGIHTAACLTALLASASGCKGEDAHVEFVYAAQHGEPMVQYLVGIVGEHKAHHRDIRPGDRPPERDTTW